LRRSSGHVRPLFAPQNSSRRLLSNSPAPSSPLLHRLARRQPIKRVQVAFAVHQRRAHVHRDLPVHPRSLRQSAGTGGARRETARSFHSRSSVATLKRLRENAQRVRIAVVLPVSVRPARVPLSRCGARRRTGWKGSGRTGGEVPSRVYPRVTCTVRMSVRACER